MQYLEGETLADRLQKGALPLHQALEIASHLGDALDKAHRAGIVHRDLKPGNIMLTKAGAKLLDFGLAKTAAAFHALGAGPQGPISATVAKPLTTQGMILGTLHYMAPEQIEGHEVDARTDIWALGCVMYEMLTGHRAFDGVSVASIITAVMNADLQVPDTFRATVPLGSNNNGPELAAGAGPTMIETRARPLRDSRCVPLSERALDRPAYRTPNETPK